MATPLLSRAQWGARPQRRAAPALNAQGNTAHYGGPSPWTQKGIDRSSPARFAATTDHNRCASIWRGYQSFHLDGRGWNDIAYSSGICPHGVRYEGRGPGRRTGAQGSPGNERSHATCYIAGEGDPLTDGAKHAYLDEEARLGTLRWNHQDWMSTACAGNPIRAWLKAGKPRPGSAAKPPSGSPVLPPAGDPILRRGSKGEAVRAWQANRLIPLGHLPAGQADGDFGPATEAATKDLQRRARITVDGIVGPATRQAARDLLGTNPTPPKENFLMALSAAKQNTLYSNAANAAAWSLMAIAEVREVKAFAHRCELRIIQNERLIREVITSGEFTQKQAELFDERLRKENEELAEAIAKIDAECDKDVAKLKLQIKVIVEEAEAAGEDD